MLIDRVLFPIESLGPGKRLVIWTVGCSKQCDQCSNKELWQKDPARNISVLDLVTGIEQALQGQSIEGITLTGGDPLEQHEELTALLPYLVRMTEDILIYTGYTLHELETIIPEEEWTQIRSNIAVLIDGRYEDEKNDGISALKGSNNQKIHYFKQQVREKYAEYLHHGRQIQNIYYGSRILSVGIHNKE